MCNEVGKLEEGRSYSALLQKISALCRIKCSHLLNSETRVIARIALADKAGEIYLLWAWFFNLVCIHNRNKLDICSFFSKYVHIF
jgi:hypothetical protein